MTKRRSLLAMSAVWMLLLAVVASPGSPAQAATPTFYTNRTSFEAALGTTVTDDYGTPPYPAGFGIYNNAPFSAYLGETDYQSTGFANLNILSGGAYCAGCNGSFQLSFLTTSVTQGGTGVYGVGLDIVRNDSWVPVPYYAFITYGDGTTDDIALPVVPDGGLSFFGVTAPELIASIHFGLSGGGSTTSGSFQIDNLTIGDALQEQPGLGDLAWYDTNQNGIQDAGEPGVQGIDVDLYDNGTCGGTAIASDTTDASGNYLFTGLPAGTYCLEFYNIPAAWSITLQNEGSDDTVDSDADPATGRIENINLTIDDLDQDIGLYVEGSVGDRVWCDSDLNGAYDAGEGVAGVTVRLFRDPECDTVANALLATQDTAGDGQYLFSGLAVGPPGGPPVCYVVRVQAADMGECDESITPTEYDVSLEANDPDELESDFGFQVAPVQPVEEEFVPEPGTILLLGSGLAGLAGHVALRRRARE